MMSPFVTSQRNGVRGWRGASVLLLESGVVDVFDCDCIVVTCSPSD